MNEAYVWVFAVSAAVTALASPLCRVVALRLAMVAGPSARSPDDHARPMLGGIAMFCGLGAGLVAASRFSGTEGLVGGSPEVVAVFAAAALTLVVGVVDDDVELSPRAKLIGQLVSCIPLVGLGAMVLFLQLPGGQVWTLGPVLAPVLTVIWVIAVSTAVNFIDGLDGLAAGVVGISCLALGLFAFRLDEIGLLASHGDSPVPVLAVVTAGICAGFLTANFHPARLIMGDGGALMLGVLVASTAALLGGQQTIELPRSTIYFALSPLLVPVVILGVPVLNTGLAVLRRARRGLSPAVADKEHLHDRLMQLGHGHRRTVVILWVWTALLSALALIPAYTDQSEALAPVVLAAAIVGVVTVLQPIRLERRRRLILERAGPGSIAESR